MEDTNPPVNMKDKNQSHDYDATPHKKKFKLKMPGAFVILFILTVVAVLATWMIPAGAYSKLSYEPSSQELKIVNPHQEVKKVPATQQQLDKMLSLIHI